MYYIGIDCGLSGFISILDSCGKLVEIIKAPLKDVTGMAIKHWYNTDVIIETFNKYQDAMVVLEMQQVFSGQGIVTNGTTMRGFGLYEGLLSCLYNGKFSIVKAVNWQNYLAKKYIKDYIHCFNKKSLNLTEVYGNIENEKFKTWYMKYSTGKSIKMSKVRSAFVYYVIATTTNAVKSISDIKYTNNNAIDAFLISRYCYEIHNNK